jgi:hypothetical protein
MQKIAILLATNLRVAAASVLLLRVITDYMNRKSVVVPMPPGRRHRPS